MAKKNEPWKTEPDKLDFHHKKICCSIQRGPVGALCGYVSVKKGHPAFGKHYDELDISCHGGLTYSENRLPSAIAPDGDWWFGFDCAHWQDYCPEMEADELFKNGKGGRTYKDVAYVKAECFRVAEQLLAMVVK